jgi:hypothetical protein
MTLPVKYVPFVILGCVVIITGAYLIYLASSWQMMSQEHALRESRMNDILDKMPKSSHPVANDDNNTGNSDSTH